MEDGHCRSIGLSTVDLPTLRKIVDGARIKPAAVEVEAHPYLPEWELLDYCKQQGIVLLAFAALGHAMEPRPARPSGGHSHRETPWARRRPRSCWPGRWQRGTAFLTTSVSPRPHSRKAWTCRLCRTTPWAELRDGISTEIRFNSVVTTGIPGFIPRGR